jgi:hypothetical protein
MSNKLQLGLWRAMIPVPGIVWKDQIDKAARDTTKMLGFMSRAHHHVRDFVVREIPRVGKPLSPAFIAQELDLPLDQVREILDELEVNMRFLYRGDGENVTWAYPVTVDRTPHRVTFSTGEQGYAA